jgi:hypothetical protein
MNVKNLTQTQFAELIADLPPIVFKAIRGDLSKELSAYSIPVNSISSGDVVEDFAAAISCNFHDAWKTSILEKLRNIPAFLNRGDPRDAIEDMLAVMKKLSVYKKLNGRHDFSNEITKTIAVFNNSFKNNAVKAPFLKKCNVFKDNYLAT